MFLHFHFETLPIKLCKCKPWRLSDITDQNITKVSIKKKKRSSESLKWTRSYRSWMISPSSDTKLRYIDIRINDPSSRLTQHEHKEILSTKIGSWLHARISTCISCVLTTLLGAIMTPLLTQTSLLSHNYLSIQNLLANSLSITHLYLSSKVSTQSFPTSLWIFIDLLLSTYIHLWVCIR